MKIYIFYKRVVRVWIWFLRQLGEDRHAILVFKFTHSSGAWDMLHAGILVLLLCVLPYKLFGFFGDGDGS